MLINEAVCHSVTRQHFSLELHTCAIIHKSRLLIFVKNIDNINLIICTFSSCQPGSISAPWTAQNNRPVLLGQKVAVSEDSTSTKQPQQFWVYRSFRRSQRSQQTRWAARRWEWIPINHYRWETHWGFPFLREFFKENPFHWAQAHIHEAERPGVYLWEWKSLLCQPCLTNFNRQPYIKDCKCSITEETLRVTKMFRYSWRQTT